MLTVNKYLLDSKQVQTIETHEISRFLDIRIENERSKPELYILEDTSSNKTQRRILVCQEGFEINYNIDSLIKIGMYSIRDGLHKFWVFEIEDSAKPITSSMRSLNLSAGIGIQGSQGSQGTALYASTMNHGMYNHNSGEFGDHPIAKYARVPKPDFTKTYTFEELKAMDSIRQLKPLTQHYGLKGRTKNRISKENQIKFILSCQEGNPLDANKLVASQTHNSNETRYTQYDSPTLNYIKKTPSNMVLSSANFDQLDTNNMMITPFEKIIKNIKYLSFNLS